MAKVEGEKSEVNISNSVEVEAHVANLQESLAKMADVKAMPKYSAMLFSHLNDQLTGVNGKISTLVNGVDMLITQLAATSNVQNKEIAELRAQVGLICNRFNIYLPKPVSEKKSLLDGILEQLSSKYPEKCFVSGLKNVLSPGFEFDFKIGDLHFGSMEQAFYYITFQYMDLPEMAIKVKRATSPAAVNAVMTPAVRADIDKKESEWLDAMKEIATSLFMLRLKQCKEFEEKIQEDEIGNYKMFVYVNIHMLLGTGCNLTTLVKAPDSYNGKNLYGTWLKEFVDAHRLGFPGGGEPFDVKKYCTYEAVPLSEDREKVLVLGDVQLSGFKEKAGTKLVVEETMRGVSADQAKNESHTAKSIIEAEKDLDSYMAVVLLFGTYEVGNSPDKLETDYSDLLKFIRGKAPHVAVFVANTLPRTDKMKEQVKLTNYAIGIATRSIDDPRVVLLDINDKISKADWKQLLKPNGFTLNEKGAEKLAHILAEQVPFVDIVPPFTPPPQKVVSKIQKSVGGFGKSSPPNKRGRYSGPAVGSQGYSRASYSSYSRNSFDDQGSSTAGLGYSQSSDLGSYSPWAVGNAGAATQNFYGGGGYHLGGGRKFDY